MQGYILNINPVKDEDLIVTILTPKKLKKLYRFYGARHANINLGYKIDFEAIHSIKSTISMLRNVIHLNRKWTLQSNRFYIWQQMIKLLYKHLRDIEDLDEFYFNLLEHMNNKFEKQNPLRVCIEAYLELLSHEGRLHTQMECFICDEYISDNPVLTRAFLTAHKKCVYGKVFNRSSIIYLFKSRSTLFLEDRDIEQLWNIILDGL